MDHHLNDRLRQLTLAAAAVVALTVCAGSAYGAVSFNISGTDEISGSGSTFTGSVVITFENNGADTVKLTIDASGASDANGMKIEGLYFNVDNVTPSTIGDSLVSGQAATLLSKNDLGAGGNAGTFKADGDGFFDLVLSYPANSDFFNAGETSVYNLTAVGLDETDFQNAISVGGPVGNNGYNVVLRVISLDDPDISGADDEGSGWFSDPPPDETPIPGLPEPTSLAIWALGMVAAGFGARRMRKQK